MIKTALNDVGCEELPSGCDLSVEQTFIEADDDHQPTIDQPVSIPAMLMRVVVLVVVVVLVFVSSVNHMVRPHPQPKFASPATAYLLKKGAKALRKIKAPFKRKSTPNGHIHGSSSCATDASFSTPKSTPFVRRHSMPRLTSSVVNRGFCWVCVCE